ncbi:MAG: translation initiation factor IF-2 subunit beta [Desulfurococcaceae archaeon]
MTSLKKIHDYTYEELLERAFIRLAGRRGSGEVFEVPKASVLVIGGKTIIQNFRDIAQLLNREEELLKRYFMKELNVPGSVNEAGQLELRGKFSAIAINQLLERFAQKYVKCATCGSFHTKLAKRGKIFTLKCEACGAETTFQAF